jgi:hypothetical protein
MTAVSTGQNSERRWLVILPALFLVNLGAHCWEWYRYSQASESPWVSMLSPFMAVAFWFALALYLCRRKVVLALPLAILATLIAYHPYLTGLAELALSSGRYSSREEVMSLKASFTLYPEAFSVVLAIIYMVAYKVVVSRAGRSTRSAH